MNDFVFRDRPDGSLAFVGDFESLYRSDPDPWEQSGMVGTHAAYYTSSRSRIISLVRRLFDEGCGLEVGCGHGYVTALLGDLTPLDWDGLDISETAVTEARRIFINRRFYVGDIRDSALTVPAGDYDIVLLNQVLWYILDALDETIANAARLLKPGGVLIVSQAFLKGAQRYGADLADGFGGTVATFHSRYRDTLQLIDARYDDRDGLIHRDGLLAFRKITC